MNYQKHYDALVNRGKNRILEGYKERHHIIPRCIGGTDSKENLVELTASEHFIAHQLLVKIYPKHPGLIYACTMMCAYSKGQVRNNKAFGWIRERFAIQMSKLHKGRKNSAETKLKMSKSSKGKPKSAEHRDSISKAFKGVTYITPEGRRKISDTHTGKFVSSETKLKMSDGINKINVTVVCPWCGKQGKLTGMKSWHFDRCKENPNGLQRSLQPN